MTADLTVDGYTFDNPPDEFSKEIELDNEPVPHFGRTASDFFQSDSQGVTVTVKGDLSLNESSDLSELETLQAKAIAGGSVSVDFDPFFSGTGVLTDTPFRQEGGRGRYNMTIAVNQINTDPSGFPTHAEPTTGNVFELGGFTFGFDPDTVRQEYERQTADADRLTGLNRTTDTKGLIPRVEVSGLIDGAGAQEIWSKARNNELSYLSAEFQNGWALLSKVLVANEPNTPAFVTGLYRYTAEFVIVKDPSSGIGEVTAVIDKEVRDSGTYVGDPDTGDGSPDSVQFTVQSGSTDIGGQTVNWSENTVSAQLSGLTNSLYASDPDGDGNAEVRINQSAAPSDAIDLYGIETTDTGISTVTDRRSDDTSGGDGTVGPIGYEITGGSGALQDDFIQWDTVTVDVDLNATNYVYVVDPDGDGQGTVTVNQSAVPSDALPLWEVTTDGDSVTDEGDQRDTLIGDPPPDGSDVAFSTSLQVDDGPGLSFNIGPDFADSVADPLLSQAYQQQAFLSEPVTDPSDSVLTALTGTEIQTGLSVSDGGVADVAAAEQEQWSDTADWDNNTSESNVVHPSGTVKLEKDLSDSLPIVAHFVAQDYTKGNTWKDREGSYDATPVGPPTKKSSVINGHPAVVFDTDEYFYTQTNVPNSTLLSAFIVIGNMGENPNGNNFQIAVGEDTFDWYLAPNVTDYNYNVVCSAGLFDDIPPALGNTNDFRVLSYYQITDGVFLYEAGTQILNISSGNTAASGELLLGYGEDDRRYIDSDIAEIIIADGTNSSDRSEIWSYLSDKYGLTTP